MGLINLHRRLFSCRPATPNIKRNVVFLTKESQFAEFTKSLVHSFTTENISFFEEIFESSNLRIIFILCDILLFIYKTQHLFLLLGNSKKNDKNPTKFVSCQDSYFQIDNPQHIKTQKHDSARKLKHFSGFYKATKTSNSTINTKYFCSDVEHQGSLYFGCLNPLQFLNVGQGKTSQKLKIKNKNIKTCIVNVLTSKGVSLFFSFFLFLFLLFYSLKQFNTLLFIIKKEAIKNLETSLNSQAFPFLKFDTSTAQCYFHLEPPLYELPPQSSYHDISHLKLIVDLAMNQG